MTTKFYYDAPKPDRELSIILLEILEQHYNFEDGRLTLHTEDKMFLYGVASTFRAAHFVDCRNEDIDGDLDFLLAELDAYEYIEIFTKSDVEEN